NDPAVIKTLEQLGEKTSLVLPKSQVECGAEKLYNCHLNGPVTRGYCNRLAYAPERETALYHGGDHQVLRSNDVWELHLGSNTWHMVLPRDGGNQGNLKAVLMWSAARLRDPIIKIEEAEEKRIEETKTWWQDNVVLKDGWLVTRRGGPLMPGHTWDTLVY